MKRWGPLVGRLKTAAFLTSLLIVCLAILMPINVLGSAPSTPQDLQVQTGKTFVDLSWKAPVSAGGGNITVYSLYKGTGSETLFHLTNLTANVTAFHDQDVEAGTTYFYQLTVWNNDGESGWSNMVVVTTPDSEQTSDQTLIGVAAIAVAAIALQLSIIAIWVMLKKGNRKP